MCLHISRLVTQTDLKLKLHAKVKLKKTSMLLLKKLTSKCLKSFVRVVSQVSLVIFILLTGPNQLGLVCRSKRHYKLTYTDHHDMCVHCWEVSGRYEDVCESNKALTVWLDSIQ